MSENEEVKVVRAGGELRRLIEKAGKLQAAQTAAKNRYEKCRKQLNKLLEDQVGDDVPAYANTYWAIRSHDKYDEIDPLHFLSLVRDPSQRRKILYVQLGVAREEFGEEKIMRDLVRTLTNKETKLHVNKIKPEKEDK